MSEQYKYTVSIHCMTYNHEKYLADALEGFVMQKTNFPFVAVVIDDFSTDGTADILRQYEAKYPDIIKAVYLQENYYSQHKSKKPFLEPYDSQSKYIAICEGDDYWTDPHKLQKQVDYLETHEDCVMCVNATEWDCNGEKNRWGCQYDHECDLTTDEVIRNGGLYINLCSTICRKELLDKRAECQWWQIANVGDYPLHIAGTLFGNCHFFPDVMSVYRYQHEGSWTSLKNQKGNLMRSRGFSLWLKELDVSTNYMYHTSICTRLFRDDTNLFIYRYIPILEYWRTFKATKNKKKCNRFVYALIARYFRLSININPFRMHKVKKIII